MASTQEEVQEGECAGGRGKVQSQEAGQDAGKPSTDAKSRKTRDHPLFLEIVKKKKKTADHPAPPQL